LKPLQLFQTNEERLGQGIEGVYPDHLIEVTKEKAVVRHAVNEPVTRPWLKHFFLMQSLRDGGIPEDTTSRDDNLLELFKTTVPLADNSFHESALSSWRMFLESIYRDSDTPWYTGIRKVLIFDRFHSAIEQLDLELPESNAQRGFQFLDHQRSQRKIPRVPVKLFFALPGNEKERFVRILEQIINNNPHNVDVGLLAYVFFKAWDRSSDFLRLVQQEHRKDLEEWYHWVEGNLKIVGAMKAGSGDHTTTFFIYDRANLTPGEYKEVADWFLKENEFKAAYHFYYKAKEFETALDLLQNISTKEFAELTNMRRLARSERPHDLSADLGRFATFYSEEMETLRGFARIRAAETYKHVAVKARQHFDRETIETKYAFGELTEDEYQRLIRQLQERKQ
jgi:hypothetical protein